MKSLLLLFLFSYSAFGQFTIDPAVLQPTKYTAASSGNNWLQDAAGTLTNITGTTATILIAPSAGSFIAVWYGFRSDTSEVATSITNVGGTLNTFVKDWEYTNYTTHYTLGFAHCANAPSSVTGVKITIPTSGSICLIVRSYTGQITSPDPKDVTSAFATGTATTITGSNITTSASSEAIFGHVWYGSGAGTISAGTGWTKVNQVVDAANGNTMCAEERLNQNAGTYAAGFTVVSGTTPWATWANAIKGQ